jgi:hypothetical protein
VLPELMQTGPKKKKKGDVMGRELSRMVVMGITK